MCQVQPQLDQEKCTRCGLCAEACTCHRIEMGEHGPVFLAAGACERSCDELEQCVCLCEDVCPTHALSCCFEIVDDDPAAVRGTERTQAR